jgi:hypothetical protein
VSGALPDIKSEPQCERFPVSVYGSPDASRAPFAGREARAISVIGDEPMSNARNPAAALTLREAAKRGRMGESTLRQAFKNGHGPRAFKRPGSNRWRIFPDDFDAWASAHVASPGIVVPETTQDLV